MSSLNLVEDRKVDAVAHLALARSQNTETGILGICEVTVGGDATGTSEQTNGTNEVKIRLRITLYGLGRIFLQIYKYYK